MKRFVVLGGIVAGMIGFPAFGEEAGGVQTIAFVRHGEKPEKGLGQLSCQGLNRALALPPVVAKLFGKPAAIFAPDPAQLKSDSGTKYDYVRPLATIEPTAIAFGLPVNTQYGFSETEKLSAKLQDEDFRNAFVLVAWEHHEIEPIVKDLLKANGGENIKVPNWDNSDFDSIYVVKIDRRSKPATAQLDIQHEGLNGRELACPFSATIN